MKYLKDKGTRVESVSLEPEKHILYGLILKIIEL